jgi:hypothetical protein
MRSTPRASDKPPIIHEHGSVASATISALSMRVTRQLTTAARAASGIALATKPAVAIHKRCHNRRRHCDEGHVIRSHAVLLQERTVRALQKAAHAPRAQQ